MKSGNARKDRSSFPLVVTLVMIWFAQVRCPDLIVLVERPLEIPVQIETGSFPEWTVGLDRKRVSLRIIVDVCAGRVGCAQTAAVVLDPDEGEAALECDAAPKMDSDR
jgi:hypothetical protein